MNWVKILLDYLIYRRDRRQCKMTTIHIDSNRRASIPTFLSFVILVLLEVIFLLAVINFKKIPLFRQHYSIYLEKVSI